MARAESCYRCGLENPETFPACALCDAPIGTSARGAFASRSSPGTQEAVKPAQSTPSFDGVVRVADRILLGREFVSERAKQAIERGYGERRTTILVIEGARGMGTSRMLLHTARLAVSVDRGIRLEHAPCVEGRDGDFSPFPRLLLDRFRITPASPDPMTRSRLLSELAELMANASKAEVQSSARLLGKIAGISFPEPETIESDEDEEDQQKEALARFLVRDAARRPTWIGIDNAQRMDELAWLALREVSKNDASLVIVLSGEPGLYELASRYLDEAALTRIELSALDLSATTDFVRRLLPNLRELPEPVSAAIAHRTGGNPAAIRQLVFSLFESGLFQESEDRVLRADLGRFESGEMPITMDDALVARVSRLPKEERLALEYASICGESFWEGALLSQLRAEEEEPAGGSLLDDDEHDASMLMEALTDLVEKGFITQDAPRGVVPGFEYRFSGPRLRALVYNSVPEEKRRIRHLAVGRWLEVVAEAHREMVSATVGFHLEHAGELAAAAASYSRAGSFERGHRRFDRALEWIVRAEACAPPSDPMTRLDLAHELGAVLVSVGRHAEAIPAFERMYALGRRLGARGKQAAALDRIARTNLALGRTEEALSLLERALGLCREADDRRGLSSCLDDLAQVELVLGHIERARMAAIEALELRRSLCDARGEAVSLTTLGRIAIRSGELNIAEEQLQQAFAIRESLGDIEGLVQTLSSLGRVAFERGERDAALALWQRAIPIAHSLRDERALASLHAQIGEAYLVLGRYVGAETSVAKAREFATKLSDRRSLARLDVLRGRMAMRRGDERASRMLRLALDSAEASGFADLLGLAHRALGQLHALTAATDDAAADSARKYLDRSIGYFQKSGCDKELARSMLDLAHLLASRGDTRASRAVAISAATLLEATQLPERLVARHMAAI